jgi:hypothetical protein
MFILAYLSSSKQTGTVIPSTFYTFIQNLSKTVQFHPCSPTTTVNHSNLTGRHTVPSHLEAQIHLTQERGQPITTPLMYTVHVSALTKSRHQALYKILVERELAHSTIKSEAI